MRLAPNSTAIAFDSTRRRAPPSGGGRHCSAARAASSGDGAPAEGPCKQAAPDPPRVGDLEIDLAYGDADYDAIRQEIEEWIFNLKVAKTAM